MSMFIFYNNMNTVIYFPLLVYICILLQGLNMPKNDTNVTLYLVVILVFALVNI